MTRESLERVIGAQSFFSGLHEAEIAFLAQHASEQRFEKGETVFRHGEPASRFFLLRDGHVTIEIPAVVGPRLEVQHLGPGCVLGWSWLIPPYRWSFQARADEPSDVLAFDGKAILERCEEEPRFGYELMKRFSGLMSERLQASRSRLMEEWNPPGFA